MADEQRFGRESFGELAAQYSRGAQAANEVARTLAQLKDAFWESDAAESFREKVDRYTRLMNEFESRFGALSLDMAERQRTFEEAQSRKEIG